MHPSDEWLFGMRKQLKNILNTMKTVVSASIVHCQIPCNPGHRKYTMFRKGCIKFFKSSKSTNQGFCNRYRPNAKIFFYLCAN